MTLAVWNGIGGPPINPWGDGSIEVLSVTQHDEHDLPEPPKAGSDQWTYQIVSEYQIKHRVAIPTLT